MDNSKGEYVKSGDELLTVKEVAEILKAKPATIYSWAEQKNIPHVKLNGLLRFDKGDIFKWIDCNKKWNGYNTLAGRRPGKEGSQ